LPAGRFSSLFPWCLSFLSLPCILHNRLPSIFLLKFVWIMDPFVPPQALQTGSWVRLFLPW
jgi:hypothetical protein